MRQSTVLERAVFMQSSVSTTKSSTGLPYKWIVAFTVVFGIFMTILDSTIVNIAIPHLQAAFGVSLNAVQWVLTGYTLAQGVATPLTAYLADRLGTKRLYLLALTIFTLSSALCGLAWGLPALIFFRVLQAAGGAFMGPISITLLYSEFPPEERGMAMGVLGIPILVAPALGPTLGGYLITYAELATDLLHQCAYWHGCHLPGSSVLTRNTTRGPRTFGLARVPALGDRTGLDPVCLL